MPLDTPRNRYIAILALIAALILVVGWQWRPSASSEAPPSQADLTRLARISQKSTLEGMSAFFADVARQASGGLVWIENLESQGIVWDQTGAILNAAVRPHPRLQPAIRGVDDGDIPLQTELYSAPLSFRLLKAPPELALTPVRMVETRDLRDGTWLVAVSRTSGDHYEFVPGIFAGERPLTCGDVEVVELLASYPAASQPPGSAIFDLDGRLAGAVLRCGETPRLIAASTLGKAVERARAVDSQVQFRYGFRPEELDESRKNFFAAAQGLLVAEVSVDSVAWELGLRPGDLITELDGEPVNRLDDLAMMTVPMYRPEYTLTVRRGRTSRSTVFPPGMGLGSEPETNTRRAVVPAGDEPGVVIRAVEPGTAAARAGLKSGDRLLSVGPVYNPTKPDISALNEDNPSSLFMVVARKDDVLGLFFGEGAN